MTRYTSRDATAAFTRLADALGKRITFSYYDVGAWRLDLDGYVVEEIINEHGGVSRPLGYRTRTAREFVEAVSFAMSVLHEARKS